MPDTWLPYHIAYTLIVVLYGGYALSIWMRARHAQGSRPEHQDERT